MWTRLSSFSSLLNHLISKIIQSCNRDLDQDLLHLWFKFGDPTLNGSRVIARTSKWLTHGLTYKRRQRQYPMAILASGKNSIYWTWSVNASTWSNALHACIISVNACIILEIEWCGHRWAGWVRGQSSPQEKNKGTAMEEDHKIWINEIQYMHHSCIIYNYLSLFTLADI